jgi:Do/DeqQ family serine protease
MRKFQNIILSVLFAIVGSFIAIFIYTSYVAKPNIVTITEPQAVRFASFEGGAPDLTFAAENSVKAVVHIQTQMQQRTYSSGNSLYDFFFGNPYQQQEPRIQQATGSGVIISPNGYIVTNNHVIEGANQINIILNDNREFNAKLVGTDPSTDIALLKVEAENLPTLSFGNSDELRLGEWVLAVGNPFNLTSTVTAGIVSAKGRGIGIIGRDKMGIESFIQTDAAVNPGNSGGALVNTKGELVGINTAIASQTGSYSGYSFAVPVSIVKKVVDDIKQYGEVQRAIMGVNIQTLNAELAKELKLDMISGVYVQEVFDDGAAKIAGIEKGDIIIALDEVKVTTNSALQEQISKHRPGDVVKVLVIRNNKEKLFNVTLRNTSGGTGIVKSSGTILGADLAKVDEETKMNLNIRGGLEVTEISEGRFKKAGIKKGFIILAVNKKTVNNVDDLREILNNVEGGVFVEGVYKNGERAYYVFGLE